MLKNEAPYNAVITAVGHFLPEKELDNHYFEKYLDTSDEWIKTRTGISSRRILEKDQPTSYAATKAAQDALKNGGIDVSEIDLIIVATVTPDMMYPSTACIVQNNLGAKNCWGFDVLAACSGFLFSLNIAAQFIQSGTHKKVLLIGADKMSSIVDYDDRNSCILFGDAGAAVVLEPSEDKEYGLLDSILHIDGSGGKNLFQAGGGSLNPATHETVDKKMHYLFQDGKTVFKEAVKSMADVSSEIMERNGLKSEDVAYLVPHQANMRIITACADRMGVGMDKVMLNINKYGNTTAATIPLCISEYWRDGKVKKGDRLVLASFGAGYTWGSTLIRWAF